MPITVPIHGKGINTQFFGFLNLLTNYGRIIAVVSDLDVIRISEPRLKGRNDLRRSAIAGEVAKRQLMRSPVAGVGDEAGHDQKQQG
jgi:hypothetical protein